MKIKILKLILILILFSFNFALAQVPGSSQDPIISKSYLETFYNWKEIEIAPFEDLNLKQGVMLIAIQGEMLAKGNLIDLTLGRELKDEEIILNFHLILCSKSGEIKTRTKALILVKGYNKS